MWKRYRFFIILSFLCTVISCKKSSLKSHKEHKPEIVYQSDSLRITKLTENTYLHTSFFYSEDFGKVPCNGMIVKDKDEALLFDTPTTYNESKVLIRWVKNELKAKINAVVATHFHEDCVGGLEAFKENNIPSVARNLTIAYTKAEHFPVPATGFEHDTLLTVGNKKVEARFFGEGHTKDNIVGYFPYDKVMFGGCLIKEINADKGNLNDANVTDWAETVKKIREEYPDVKIVIPGHGDYGNKQLLDYTIHLFTNKGGL